MSGAKSISAKSSMPKTTVDQSSLRAKDLKRLIRRVQVLNKQPWLSIPELDMAITTCCSRLNQYYLLKVNEFRKEYSVIESLWRAAQSKSPKATLKSQIKVELKRFLPKLETLRNFVMSNSLHYTKNVKRCIQKVWLQRACMKGLMKQEFYLSRDLSHIWTDTQMLITDTPVAAHWNCPICLEIPKSPIVLSCAHWYCSDCLVRAGDHLNKCPVCRKIQKLDPSHPTVPAPYRPLAVFLHEHFQVSLPPQQVKKDLPYAIESPAAEPTVLGTPRRRKRRKRRPHARRGISESESQPHRNHNDTEIQVAPTNNLTERSQRWSDVVSRSTVTETKSSTPSSPKRAKRVERSNQDRGASETQEANTPKSMDTTDDSEATSGDDVNMTKPVTVQVEPETDKEDVVLDPQSATECEEEYTQRVASFSDRNVNFGVLDDFEVLLQHAQPGTFFALDIDDTLHCSQHNPCMMLSHQGIRAYQYLIRKRDCYRNRARDELEERRLALQSALNAKRLVQPCTAEVVKSLQAKGCWVFGLTSRYAEMADKTTATLHSLGIDLSLRSPFPAGKALFDPRTEAVCKDGIIFTNATNKAIVLNRFLEKVVFRSYPADVPVPVPEIVFVDDRMENIEHIMGGLHAVASRGIKLTCYHYVGAMTNGAPVFDSQVVLTQIDHFMQHMEILPDHVAFQIAEFNTPTQVEKPTGPTSSRASGMDKPKAMEIVSNIVYARDHQDSQRQQKQPVNVRSGESSLADVKAPKEHAESSTMSTSAGKTASSSSSGSSSQ